MRVLNLFHSIHQMRGRSRTLKMIYRHLSALVFTVLPFLLYSQEVITGTVKNSKGESIAGVTVAVKGSSAGVVTDQNGVFKIEKKQGSDTLVFSMIGYESETVSIGGKSMLNILLRSDSKTLDDVVVVGYGSQKKKNLTGAVDQIGSEYFENRPVPNVSRALEGVIPNLNISYTSGRPTQNPEWNVRGLTSIGAGGEALILIDGVVGDPRNLNADDIASVTVLKDAASASIYGSRGAFGVILITTKSPGKSSKPRITFNSSYSLNAPINKPDVVTDGYTWGKLYKDTYGGWYDYAQTPSSIGSSGLPFSDSYLDSLKYRSEHPGQLPDITVNPANGNYTYYGNTDWYNDLYKSSIPSIENSISVSGGNDKLDYAMSGKIYKQDGIYNMRSDEYKKYDFRIKGGAQVTDWLKINAGTTFSNYTYTDPFRFNIWQALNIFGNGTPLAMMYNPDGSLTSTFANSAGALLGGNNVSTKQNFQQNNASFVTTFLKNRLSIKGDINYQNTTRDIDDKVVPISYSVKPGVITTSPTSQLAKTLDRWKYLSYNLYADYTQTFGKHYLKVLIGDNYEESRYDRLGVSKDQLLIPNLNDFNLAVGQNSNISGGGNEWSNNGVFGRINYVFDSKYLLEINGRYDGSSKFPESEQFGFFPSISAGWRISEEKFLQKADWLNELKIRGSYGSLGNSQINPYLYLEQLRPAVSPVIIDGTRPSYIRNPPALAENFTWETATTINLGLDFALFSSRLSGSVDIYNRKTYDMVTPGPSLPAVFGSAIPRGNYADLETKGFEVSLGWSDHIKTKKPISYSIRFTLADNVSEITKYNNPGDLITPDPYSFITNYYVGQTVGDIWGYETEGLFTSADDIIKHADQSAIQVSAGNKPLPGDIKFKDINGDGKVNKGKSTLADHGDWKVIGNSRPRYMYGFTTNFDWNNFSFSAFFQGVGKRDWYFNTTEFWGQYNVWYSVIPKHTLENNWSLNGGDPNSYWPRYRAPLVYGDRELQPQTKYLQNVSYLRLKNISLGYSIPRKLISKIGLANFYVYVAAQNIWTTSPLNKTAKGIDVETLDFESGQRYSSNNYPNLKTFTFGINVTF